MVTLVKKEKLDEMVLGYVVSYSRMFALCQFMGNLCLMIALHVKFYPLD